MLLVNLEMLQVLVEVMLLQVVSYMFLIVFMAEIPLYFQFLYGLNVQTLLVKYLYQVMAEQ